MALTNTSKPTTSLVNGNRASSAETWATWTTSWATETRTWQGLGTLTTNTAKKLLGNYTFDEIGTFSPDQLAGLTFDSVFTPITNTPRPS